MDSQPSLGARLLPQHLHPVRNSSRHDGTFTRTAQIVNTSIPCGKLEKAQKLEIIVNLIHTKLILRKIVLPSQHFAERHEFYF